MPVTVMQIRIMRMLVQNPRMPMPVAMRFSSRIGRCMVVLVVDVMHVAMLMLEKLMQVFVVVRLGEVEIYPNAHEQRRADESKGRRLAKQREGEDCADEGSRREVSAGARRSQVTKA